MTQKQALDILKTGANVFLTGSAGSGKTYVLNEYIQYLKSREVGVAVTASTGIAATHMNGVTIHSWTGLGIRDTLNDYDIDELEQKAYLWTRFEKTQVLIIDEISMLHGYRLDMVDKICRAFKRNQKPFGGLQVVLCGDFFQLPPVTRGGALEDMGRSIYASEAWDNAGFIICYLTEQHRQNDDEFLSILNGIRAGKVPETVLAPLRNRLGKSIDLDVSPTKLYTHNVDVDIINQKELNQLPGDAKTYQMTSSGRENLVETLKKGVLAHELLHLKIGTKVMFVKNNFELGYANGTLGIVETFLSNNTPVIRTTRGEIIHVEPTEWAIEEDGKVKAAISQVPLRYAWAITIHKSQGMSLDAAEIDLSKSFTYGMGYVALSRVRSLAGISLVGMHEDALLVDPNILRLDEDLQIRSEEAQEQFAKISTENLKKLHDGFVVASGGTLITEKIISNEKNESKKRGVKNAEPKQKSFVITKELLDKNFTLEEIAKERGITVATVISHLEQLQKNGISFNFRKIQIDKKLVSAVKKVLVVTGDTKLTSIKEYLEKKLKLKVSFEEIRLARVFISFD